MCLLVFCKPKTTPDREDLETACKNNPHGFGFAVVAGNKIHTGRDMDPKRAVDRFLRERAKYPEGPALFHARMSTHGLPDAHSCHPFRGGGDKRVILAHNGIFPVGMAPKDPRSDTRLFAESILPAMGVE